MYILRISKLLLLSLIIFSCGKNKSESKGSSTVVYEPKSYIDLMTNFEAVVNKSSVYINNANPYQTILGNVMLNANLSKINGNGVEISEVVISNIMVTTVELTEVQEMDTLVKYLTDSELKLRYISNTGAYVDRLIGNFKSYNKSTKKVIFEPVTEDLTSFMENKPDHLFFQFVLNGRPTISMKLKYFIGFNYNYSYKEREVK